MKPVNRTHFLFIAFLLLGAYANAQTTDFVTVWKTNNPGTSASNQIRIYTGAAFNMNFTVAWGDGMTSSGVTRDITHTYATPGTYTVRISGNFYQIDVGESGDQLKLLSINQWGNTQWSSFFHAFDGCANMVLNTTAPPNMGVGTGCSFMFRNCTSFNTNINSWNVFNMAFAVSMFEGCTAFNQPLNNWDVRQLSSTVDMFKGCTAFNQPLNNWQLIQLSSMGGMFNGATSFNSALFSSGLSFCGAAEEMFKNATSFNQPIPSWTTSSLGYTNDMFNGATAFNQPLLFFTGKIKDATGMLDNCAMSTANYDATIENWKNNVTSRVPVTMGAMGRKYCSAAASRDILINTWRWTFVGDGPNTGIQLTSATGTNNQIICPNTSLTAIRYNTASATSASVSGLPAGVSSSFTASTSTVTISGTPTQTGTFNYTINTTGPCGAGSANGTITVQGATVNAGPALTAICPGTATPALGGSFSGPATAAIWTDGGAGGTFTNNTGSTPQTVIYMPSATATNDIVLRLTTSGGSCGAVFAEKTLVINDTATWLGLTNQWEQPTNWSKGAIPGACTRVIVNAGTAYTPRITGTNNTCYKLTLNNGINITIATNAKLLITGR